MHTLEEFKDRNKYHLTLEVDGDWWVINPIYNRVSVYDKCTEDTPVKFIVDFADMEEFFFDFNYAMGNLDFVHLEYGEPVISLCKYLMRYTDQKFYRVDKYVEYNEIKEENRLDIDFEEVDRFLDSVGVMYG